MGLVQLDLTSYLVPVGVRHCKVNHDWGILSGPVDMLQMEARCSGRAILPNIGQFTLPAVIFKTLLMQYT